MSVRRPLRPRALLRPSLSRGRTLWGAGIAVATLAAVWPGGLPGAVAAGWVLAAAAVVDGCRVFAAGRSGPWHPTALAVALGAPATLLAAAGSASAVVPLGATVVLLAEGVRRLGRRDRLDRGSLLDAAMVTMAIVAVLADRLWGLRIADGVGLEDLGVVAATAAGALLLGLLAYALLTSGAATLPAVRFLAAGVTGLVAVGLAEAVAARGIALPGPLGATASLVAGLAMAAGALQPSMIRAGAEMPPHPRLTEVRVVVIALCGLTPLALLLVPSGVPDRPLWPLGLCGTVLVYLLVSRLGRALSERNDDHRREAALRSGLTALVVATDDTTMDLAVVLAARNLLEDPGVTIRVLPGGSPLPSPVTVFGPVADDAPAAVVAAVPHGPDRPWLICATVPSSKGPSGLLVAAVAKEPSASALEAFGTLTGQLGLARERAAMAESMHRRHAEHRLAALVQHAFDVITILDDAFVVQFQSSSITAMTGFEPDEVVAADFRSLLDPDDIATVEAQLRHLAAGSARSTTRIDCRLRHRNDERIDVEVTATNLLGDPDIRGLVLNIRDLSEHRVLEQQLIRQAFHDPLTGLANRVLLADRADHALQATGRGGPVPAVLFIDLDDFKTVNDSLGHPAGDRLLVELGDRLTQCLRPGDTAARMGGDEFAVLVENAGAMTPEALMEVAERVLDKLAEPTVIDGTRISARASIGVATGADADNAADLLRNADLAMYIAKEQGGGVVRFEPSMHDTARRRLEMQAEMVRALERNEFEVYYQPIVALQGPGGPLDPDGLLGRPAVMGVEALVRWNHPQRGFIPPAEFIPLAEDTGLIVELGRWVMMEACRTVASWAKEGLTTAMSLTVNVSARQLQETALVDDVSWAIAGSGIDPSWLVIEITESVVMQDTVSSVGWLHALKQLGVRIAIDDFGTGYSSLAYLQMFPIDVMKIDRSFVMNLGDDPKATELVRVVINLSDSLGMTSLAEGIETREQLVELQALGCRLGQGFGFARPMSSGALINALEDGVLVMGRPGSWQPPARAGDGSGG